VKTTEPFLKNADKIAADDHDIIIMYNNDTDCLAVKNLEQGRRGLLEYARAQTCACYVYEMQLESGNSSA
jgi:hypothetical protein